MLSRHEVKLVNIILLVVGSLIPTLCKLSNDHLFKKGNEEVRIPSSKQLCFDISQSVRSLCIFLMVSFDKQNTLILMKCLIFIFFFFKVSAFCFLSKKFLPQSCVLLYLTDNSFKRL